MGGGTKIPTKCFMSPILNNLCPDSTVGGPGRHFFKGFGSNAGQSLWTGKELFHILNSYQHLGRVKYRPPT